MTIDDLKAIVAKGGTHVSFPVHRQIMSGKVVPMGEAEFKLIDAGAIWFQNRDDEKRTYLILSKSAALTEASDGTV